MTQKISVIDYDIGNVYSVCNALRAIDLNVSLTSDKNEIMNSSHVILPGVGAFGKASQKLRDSGLDETIYRYVETGKKFLGICVGMQLLLDKGLEFGEHDGLGIIPGHVEKIASQTPNGETLRTPHIQWSRIVPSDGKTRDDWENTPLPTRETAGDSCYFVHSFHARCKNPNNVFSVTHYGQQEIIAAIGSENVFGTQFHPERSGPFGLEILKNFSK